MLAQYAETNTPASRVLYINSKDATTYYNNNQSNFDFVLDEPIVVPDHQSILMSIYSAEIPYSFYNFRNGVNTILDYQTTPYNMPATYDINGFLDLTAPGYQRLTLPEGNYNAVELANYLTTNIPNLECLYDPIRMKFSFRCLTAGFRITLALRNGPLTGTIDAPGNDMNEELGFDFINITGDPFVERDPVGLNEYWYGFSNGNPGVPGAGVDASRSGPYLVAPAFYLFGDDVVDMTNSIRSLFIRTNLSTTSVLDSHIGGGFSNILTRVAINAEPGGVINVRPADGDVHKLLLKVKAITEISMQLTNQQNQVINLNGLTFDISLKLEFILTEELPNAPNRRLDYERDQRQTVAPPGKELTVAPPGEETKKKKGSKGEKKDKK